MTAMQQLRAFLRTNLAALRRSISRRRDARSDRRTMRRRNLP